MPTGPEPVDPRGWNEALQRSGGSFLQSFEWGEFQATLGREIVRLRSSSFQALLIRHDLPFGKSYLYCPRGPVALQPGDPQEGVIVHFVERARALGGGAIFLKIEPEWAGRGDVQDLLRAHGFTRSRAEMQPAKTLMLDLSRPEDEILGAMKKGRRYDIRLAERKGVSARRLGREQHDAFLQLLEETARRDRFRTHPRSYYQEMIELFENGQGARPFVELWGAEYEGQLLAINLVLFWGERVTYLHAASSSHHRDVMAPAFLQWHVLKEAKRRGYKEYDLWGISEAWPGVTAFKKAFGGAEVEYVGCFELPLNRLAYRIYRSLRSIRYRA